MHTTPTLLSVHLSWIATALAGTLELEGVHRLRRLFFGVHPVVAGARLVLLCALGMAGAAGLSYTLIYINHLLHLPHALNYELPWVIYIFYMFFLDERERRAARAHQSVAIIDQEED